MLQMESYKNLASLYPNGKKKVDPLIDRMMQSVNINTYFHNLISRYKAQASLVRLQEKAHSTP
jgi:hypothetical protein